MDILATLVPQAAAPVQASAAATDPATAPEQSFSAVLSQVTAAAPEPLPVALPQPLPVVAVVPEVAVAPEPVATPAPIAVQPLPVAEPQTVAVEEVESVLPAEPAAEVEEPKTTTKADSRLDDIRQRMALIESAGQLDTAAVIVVPPIPVSVPVPVSVAPADPAPVFSSTPVHSQSLPVADDEPDDTADPVDLPDALPTLVASVADNTPAVHPQTEDSQPDSQPDPQTVFNLAPASFAPANTVATDSVANSSLVLTAAIGSTDWAADLGQQMVDMVTRGDQQVDLRLHPAELGPLSISLNLNDGTTQAQFQVAHASVRAAVEQALPQLREALATQGIALGQASVSDQSSRQASGGQSHRDPQPQSASAPLSRTEPTPVQHVVLSGSAIDLYV